MPYANTRFHPIGQGCFYSGEIYCFPSSDPVRIVYDCGSETSRGALEREVGVFHQLTHDAKLDMLVLSHLDADHVNGLSLLLDNGLTARNVFLPYLTPVQRAIAAASSGGEGDPDYFELLADPVGFLEARGVENIIFISGGEDEENRNSGQDVPPFQPSDESGDSPNLGDLEDDRDGKLRFRKCEESKLPPQGGQLTQDKLPVEVTQTGEAEDSRSKQTANLYFKSDSRNFRLTRCWQGKFFHRDDMRLLLNTICGGPDFTIRPDDSTSVQRYKRFLADVHGRFGTLDPGRLVMAIRDEADRQKLRECYRHIRGNHTDVSLVFWHGPIQVSAIAQLASGAHTRGWDWTAEVTGRNGGTLLTGDLTCTNRVVENMRRHFGIHLADSVFLHVPHHGSVHSWNDRLLHAMNSEIIAVICAGRNNSYHHPHPQVRNSLAHTNGGIRWFVSDERNIVAMRIETI